MTASQLWEDVFHCGPNSFGREVFLFLKDVTYYSVVVFQKRIEMNGYITLQKSDRKVLQSQQKVVSLILLEEVDILAYSPLHFLALAANDSYS